MVSDGRWPGGAVGTRSRDWFLAPCGARSGAPCAPCRGGRIAGPSCLCGRRIPVPELGHETEVLLVQRRFVSRLPCLLLRLVQETIAGRVRRIAAQRASDLNRRRSRLGALGTLELPMPLLAAYVAVVLLPGPMRQRAGHVFELSISNCQNTSPPGPSITNNLRTCALLKDRPSLGRPRTGTSWSSGSAGHSCPDFLHAPAPSVEPNKFVMRPSPPFITAMASSHNSNAH